MLRRRSLLALGLVAGVGGCGYGHRAFYEVVPARQFKIAIDESARDALLECVTEFANDQGFTIYRETFPSAPLAPSVFWTLEQFAGMIVIQNPVIGSEPDAVHREVTLSQHSQTEFSAMFYRSMFGYSDARLTQLIALFDSRVSAVAGVREFVDAFSRNLP